MSRRLRTQLLAWTWVAVTCMPCCKAASCGDCDGDGVVAIVDALVASQQAASIFTLSGRVCLCDVHPAPAGDGVVTILDALLIAKAAAGLPVALGCAGLERQWREVAHPQLLSPGHIAFDPGRNQMASFGFSCGIPQPAGIYDGVSWRSAGQQCEQPYPNYSSFAFDTTRGVGVHFGGYYNIGYSLLDETWELRGNAWTRRATPIRPPSRMRAAMAYDSLRGVTVLFGGVTAVLAGTLVQDTWEWDGVTWSVASPVISPSARGGHAMAFDDQRGVTVLFGGGDASGHGLDDTWEFDGATWTQRSTPTSPPARAGHAMAFDSMRGVTVMNAGSIPPGIGTDTWEYDGVDWILRTGVSLPGGRTGHTMTYDSTTHEVLMQGGLAGYGSPDATLWAWDGATWSVRSSRPLAPDLRRHAAAVYDESRSNLLLFGGWSGAAFTPYYDDTWRWTGTSGWSQLPVAGPSSRIEHAMSYDATTTETVLFGGEVATGASAETWVWDGTAWLQRFPAQSPIARWGHSMTFDRARNVTVLFGGEDDTSGTPLYFSDTWEWDGVSWTQRMPATGLPPLADASMTYDQARGVTVLFGGRTVLPPSISLETWEWDGVDWTRRSGLPVMPPARYHAELVYDSDLQVAILYGGRDGLGIFLHDTWEYDGVTWTLRARAARTTSSPETMASAYDTDAHRVRLISSGCYTTMDMWVY